MAEPNSTAPTLGTVTFVDNELAPVSTCLVDINGEITRVNVVRRLTGIAAFKEFDVVLVTRVGASWYLTDLTGLTTQPAPTTPAVKPPPSKPAIRTGQLVVTPVETRSYRTTYGWRDDNTDVYQGAYGGWGLHTGCAFYGSKPRSLAGATVTSCVIRVQRPANTGETWGSAATTLRLMTNATRPAGAPTLQASTTAGPTIKSGVSSTFTLPDSWGQALVNGTAGGIAMYDADGSPYVIYSGRGRWSPAFTMTIGWRRA